MSFVRSSVLLSFAMMLIMGGVLVESGEANRILQSYTTNPDRTETVKDLCAAYSDRTTLVDETAQEENDAYKAAMAAQFSLQGYFYFKLDLR